MMQRIFTTSLKSGLVATLLLIQLIQENIGSDIVPVFFLAYAITSVIAFFAIVLTIMPLYAVFAKITTKKEFVRLVFPYYAVFIFLLMLLFLYEDSDLILVVFPAFVSALLAWLWLFNEKNNKKNENEKSI